jgi:hypothetical protein
MRLFVSAAILFFSVTLIANYVFAPGLLIENAAHIFPVSIMTGLFSAVPFVIGPLIVAAYAFRRRICSTLSKLNGDAIAAPYDPLFAQWFPFVSAPSNTARLVNV